MTDFGIGPFELGDKLQKLTQGLQQPRRLLGEQNIERGEGLSGGGGGFGGVLKGALQDVMDRKEEIKDKVERLAAGEPVELHDLMIAMGKSEVTFNLMLEVRNKFVEAWRELNRSVV